MAEIRRMLRTTSARQGALLVALAFLLGSSASFHGYLLAPYCEGADPVECHPPAAENQGLPDCLGGPASRSSAVLAQGPCPSHQPCQHCDQMCCFAVSVALAGYRSRAREPARPSLSPPSSAAPPRGALREHFRPPVA